MRIMYAFVPHFECVTLINGAFNERPAALSYPSASPLYITLLPLRAMLLPYTVRLIGGKVASNAELARSFEAGADRYIITFDERHNYVYSPRTPVTHPPTDPAERFFRAVKSGDVGLARGMMTKELSESVTDEALADFFSPYSYIAPNPYSDIRATHFLAPSEGRAEGFVFAFDGSLLADIEEL